MEWKSRLKSLYFCKFQVTRPAARRFLEDTFFSNSVAFYRGPTLTSKAFAKIFTHSRVLNLDTVIAYLRIISFIFNGKYLDE